MPRSRACRIPGRRSPRYSPEEQAMKKLFALALVSFAAAAWAQPYPTRAVRIVVPAATGGPHIVARAGAGAAPAPLRPPGLVEDPPRAHRLVGAAVAAQTT